MDMLDIGPRTLHEDVRGVHPMHGPPRNPAHRFMCNNKLVTRPAAVHSKCTISLASIKFFSVNVGNLHFLSLGIRTPIPLSLWTITIVRLESDPGHDGPLKKWGYTVC